MLQTKDLGLDLVVIGSVIATAGVLFNNILLLHVTAMQIWVISNLIFAGFFYGRWKQWWDGGLADEVMCGMYLVMLVSGIWGLMQ